MAWLGDAASAWSCAARSGTSFGACSASSSSQSNPAPPQISAEVLGQKTGLDSGRSSQLLAILAPIVMSFLAQRFAQSGNAGQLSQALGQEAQQSSGGIGSLLGGALDQDGDGQFGASDLFKLGAGLLKR